MELETVAGSSDEDTRSKSRIVTTGGEGFFFSDFSTRGGRVKKDGARVLNFETNQDGNIDLRKV